MNGLRKKVESIQYYAFYPKKRSLLSFYDCAMYNIKSNIIKDLYASNTNILKN